MLDIEGYRDEADRGNSTGKGWRKRGGRCVGRGRGSGEGAGARRAVEASSLSFPKHKQRALHPTPVPGWCPPLTRLPLPPQSCGGTLRQGREERLHGAVGQIPVGTAVTGEARGAGGARGGGHWAEAVTYGGRGRAETKDGETELAPGRVSRQKEPPWKALLGGVLPRAPHPFAVCPPARGTGSGRGGAVWGATQRSLPAPLVTTTLGLLRAPSPFMV